MNSTQDWKPMVLIVDDDPDTVDMLSKFLKAQNLGIDVRTASTAKEAVTCTKRKMPNIVILDIKLPDASGIQVLAMLRDMDLEMPIIMITAYADMQNSIKALNEGAYAYITKPFDFAEVKSVLRRSLAKSMLHRQNKDTMNELHETNQQLERIVQELAENNQLHKAIINSAGEGIVVVDTRGCIISVNPAAEELLGVREEEVIGKIVNDQDFQEQCESLSAVVRDRRQRSVSVENDRRSARDYDAKWSKNVVMPGEEDSPVEVINSPLVDEDGTFLGRVFLLIKNTD